MRNIKFRAWDKKTLKMSPAFVLFGEFTLLGAVHEWQRESAFDIGLKDYNDSLGRLNNLEIMQFTGLYDKNGKEIYEGDVLEFTDKWEWYKGSYGIKMHFAEPERLKELRQQYEKEPMERRVIEMPECYNWLLSSEVQTYWLVIGNIYENSELLKA